MTIIFIVVLIIRVRATLTIQRYVSHDWLATEPMFLLIEVWTIDIALFYSVS